MARTAWRTAAAGAALVLALAACSPGDGGSGLAEPAPEGTPETDPELGPFEDVPSAVEDPEADGRELEFEPTADGFTDTATGSTWTIFGEAVAGPLEGERLPEVDHVDTFWFSWVAFTPETDVAPALVE